MRGAGRAASCPRSLDCALQRRQFCPPGSGACGPCLPTFQEDARGRCVQKPRPRSPFTPAVSPGTGRTSIPSLEKEIDFLADVLARQEALRPHPLRDGKPRSKCLLPHCHHSLQRCRQPHGTRPCSPGWFALPGHCSLGWGPCRARPPRLSLLSPQPGDKTLAQSAQMYHYQHQKQQMLSMEKHKEEPKLPDSASSDEENEDGDFTVYECPGLAPTGEMELAMDSMPNTGGAPAAGRRGTDPALPDCSTPAQ
uniref:Neural proliferation, differentiation and control 1 n=1 Tax=Otus sunia TaxID=257818 RepID=A0A8C8ADD6_9STRI